jgi:4,5-DOPA dioxygenase extradiol
LDYQKSPQEHYEIGQQLRPLREEGVLIIGSGNIVHNLGIMNPRIDAYDWAATFDETAKNYLIAKDHQALVNYPDIPHNQLAIPTNEHFLPLLYILGLQEEGDSLSFAAESLMYGSLSMRCVLFK